MTGEALANRLLAWVISRSVCFPHRVVLFWIFFSLALVPAALNLRIETSTDSVLDRGSTAWDFYDQTLEKFGGDETVVVAVEGRRPFDPLALAQASLISSKLGRIPGIRRVDSVTTVPFIDASADGTLNIDPLLVGQPPYSDEKADDLRARIARDRIAPRTLVSEDGSVIAVNATLEHGVKDFARVVDQIRAAATGMPHWISGVPVFRTELNRETQAEVLRLIPLTVALMVLLLGVAFRSARAVVVPLVTASAGTWIFVGALAMSGTALTAGTMILPSVMLAVGCAYGMHMLSEASGHKGEEAVSRALIDVAQPLALAGLTTAVGFGAMAVVPIDAVREVGIFGGIGTLAVAVAALTLGPAIISLWPGTQRSPLLMNWMRVDLVNRIVEKLARHRSAVIVSWVALLGVFGLGVWILRVESDVVLYFPRGSEVRDSYEEIKTRLSGISPMNVVITSESGRVATEPDVLRAVAGLQEHLAAMNNVGKVVSIADPMIQIHSGFEGVSAPELPPSREIAEQYLLLLESVGQLRDLISADHQTANILLRANHNGSEHLLAIASDAEDWWRANGPRDFRARATGIMYEFARAERELGVGQLQGLSLDVATVAALLLLIFRNLRVAALALVPNLVPLVLVFGFMGLAGIPLDIGTVLVGNLAVGIAVDETIHVIHAFNEQRALGVSSREAVRDALSRVLPALVYTTVIVAVGFSALAVSQFTFTRNLGLLTAGIMLICVISNATLLPAMLIGRATGGSPREGLAEVGGATRARNAAG